MRAVRTVLVAAALGAVAIAGTPASASTIPPPKPGQDPITYLCSLARASCNDVPCGPRSCDLVSDRAR